MNWAALRNRYSKDDLARRLGNLASTLGRVSQRALNVDSLQAVPLAVRESMHMMEWNLHVAPPEVLAALAPMQAELGLWWRSWAVVAQSATLRHLLSQRAREMSDQVLQLSGLLNQP
jgi:hypothetical protein